MDHFTKRRVALWDFNGPYDQIAESEWIAWFNLAFEEEPHDLDSLKKRLETTIRFDVKILDAESHVSKMLDELMRALERDNQEWILYEEGKVVVDLMVKAVRPSMLQSAAHKVTDCPKTTPGEAQDLLAVQMQKWKDARVVRPTSNVIDLGPTRSKIEGGVTVADVVVVDNLLLDTGGNVNVASVGLVEALEKANVATQVVVDDTPTALYPYGKATKPVLLSRRLRLSVALTTTCGPLLLRGLPVWVDDDADDDVALIISRPVMESLGFSTDALLVNARSLISEWDMSDSEFLPSADAAVNWMCASRPAVQDLNPEVGMDCSTPMRVGGEGYPRVEGRGGAKSWSGSGRG
ncbi:hypothetical protein DYB32_006578 [Aphanomyces invadans]|uniref:Uncharacterized protein n=1 Tax=Aphanomyces invadans TaxID=157072 RepID=A0A418ARP1_9STRA|nr:hypothetical protein DYB32_006578 [Aphanomyces invadans]